MRNQGALSALDEAAETEFDQAEAAGATVQEATTAAQEAVSREVTGEGSRATNPPADDPEPPVIKDMASDDEQDPQEEPPTVMQDSEVPPNILRVEVQLEEIPSEQEGEYEGFIGALDDIDQPPPVAMARENLDH